MQSVIYPLEVFSIFLLCWGKSLINYNSPFQQYKMLLLSHWSLRTPVSSTCFWKMWKGNYFAKCQRLVAIFAFDCLCQEIWLPVVDKRHLRRTTSQLTIKEKTLNSCVCWINLLGEIPNFLGFLHCTNPASPCMGSTPSLHHSFYNYLLKWTRTAHP